MVDISACADSTLSTPDTIRDCTCALNIKDCSSVTFDTLPFCASASMPSNSGVNLSAFANISLALSI